jgi:hypothetical protein
MGVLLQEKRKKKQTNILANCGSQPAFLKLASQTSSFPGYL